MRGDLERAASSSFYAHDQRGRFDHALRELNRAARLARRGPAAEVVRVFGWAFAIWGTFLYWWAAMLYLTQARDLVKGAAAS